MDKKLQIELYNDFMKAYRTAMKEHKFKSEIFLRMLNDHGPYETAKRLTNQLDWQSGYEKLAFLGRTDLTVEHIILGDKYRNYFTEKQIYNAEEKIRQAKQIEGHKY
jgi:hypothetical protein